MKENELENAIHGFFLLMGLVTVGCVLLITVYLIISGMPAIREIGLVKFLFGTVWAPTPPPPSSASCPSSSPAFTARRGHPPRRARRLDDGVFSPKWPRRGAAVSPHRGEPAGGHPVGGVRPGGHAGAGAGIRKPFHILRRLPAGGHHRAGHHDPALHHQRVRDGPRGGAAEYEDASLALGATPRRPGSGHRPAARSGIAAAVVLGVGRAIGEAMAVMMVAGNVPNMPDAVPSVRS